MVHSFFLLTLLWLATPTITLERYQPLFPRHFAAGDDGSFYILDQQDHRITHYDRDLNQLRSFGKQGQGPGEFIYPDNLFYFSGKVYVQDDAFITVFTGDGAPLQKIKKPFTGEWHPTGKSWIAYRRSFETETFEIVWLSLDFSTSKILHTDTGRTIQNNTLYLGETPIPPALSKDHRWLAKVEKDRYLIHIFDTQTGETHATVKGNVTRLPYDQDWAEKMRDHLLSRLDPSLTGADPATMKVNRPDFFSPVPRLIFTSDNHLHIYEQIAPGKAKATHAVTIDGKRVPTIPFPEKHYYKVLMVYAGQAYIATYIDEEAGITIVPHAQVAAVISQM